MKISFDGRFIEAHTGINTYSKNLITHIMKLSNEHQFRLMSFKGKQSVLANIFPNQQNLEIIERFREPRFSGKLGRSIMKIENDFSWRAESIQSDLIHCTDPSFYPMKIDNVVVTIHDIFAFYEDDWVEARIALRKRIHRILETAKLIFVPSNFVKEDLINRLNVTADRIKVTYEAGGEAFKVITPNHDWLKSIGISGERQFMMFVGRIDSRKNINRILKAYLILPTHIKKNLDLVLVANGSDEQIATLKTEANQEADGRVFFLRNISTDELVNLYNASSGLVFATIAEGFGIPVLEAMQSNCPVITSNTTCLPEISGGAALLVDPFSIESISERMNELAENESLRNDLRQKGKLWSSKFSWEKTALETLHGYEHVLSSQ